MLEVVQYVTHLFFWCKYSLLIRLRKNTAKKVTMSWCLFWEGHVRRYHYYHHLHHGRVPKHCRQKHWRHIYFNRCSIFIFISIFKGEEVEICITRRDFETACKEVLDRPVLYVKAFLTKCNILTDLIASMVLVGGSSKLPIIQRQLRELFPNSTIEAEVDPEVIVAEGAAIQAASMVSFVLRN